jgi:hypothetical protein
MTKAQEQMSSTLERLVNAVEKQQPGKATQALTTAATVAAVFSVFSAVDLVIKWFRGG